MNINLLNSRHGAPGRIVFKEGHAGHPNVVLANKYGSAEISLLGANVLSYRPTGHAEVLFRPAKRDYGRADSVHGGLPVCWPQFGKLAIEGMAGHGFIRLMVLEVRGTTYSDEMTEIVLGLKSSPDTLAIWPHEFDLEYRITLSMKLNLRLTTKNTGKTPFEFTAGFHPYLSVRNRDDVTVRGLDGLGYIFADDMSEGVFAGDVKSDRALDHVITLKSEPKHEFAVVDPGLKRAFGLAFSGGEKLVIWNPGEEGVSSFPDLAADDWKKFLCVEPVTNWPKAAAALAPGDSADFTAAVQSNLL